MAEVSIAPHCRSSAVLRAPTRCARATASRAQVQLGLTYVFAGVYDDPAHASRRSTAFHAGKAVGLDVTVLLQNWLGVRVGVPVYIDPVAIVARSSARR